MAESLRYRRFAVLAKRQLVGSRLWILSMAIGVVVVSSLNLVLRGLQIQAALYALLPGGICSLAITGGHGGSEAEETAGAIVAFTVNWVIYSVGIALILAFASRKLQGGKGDRP